MSPFFAGHPAAWAAIILGLLFCFLGRKLFTFFLACTGFLAGAFAGSVLFDGAGSFWEPALIIASGAVGAMLAILLLRVSMFLGGLMAGYAVAAGILGLAPLVCVIAGLVSGLLAAILTRHFLAVLTAVAGAATASAGAMLVWTGSPVPAPVWTAAAIVFAVIGSMVQLRELSKKQG